jgi:hypothetical protein
MQLAIGLPSGAAWSTSMGATHEPSGKQVDDSQSASTTQARQVSSAPHVGVVPRHALGSSGVHETHIDRVVSQTGVGAVHSALLMQLALALPPSGPLLLVVPRPRQAASSG